jgi:membrane protease subunit HflC
MNRRFLIWGGVALAALVVAANTGFIVSQTQQAIVVNLGQPVRVINQPGHYNPGLKIKAPFVESVVLLDKRNQVIDARREEVISRDQQRLVVDAFVRYRISNPLEFYRTLRGETNAAGLIEPLINSSLREVLGTTTAADIISGRRDALMAQTLAYVRARAARSHYGIDVIDVRIKRADLPAANQQAVYQRMKSNLEQQAAQIRAVGEQNRREIVAEADKDVTVTLADATAQAYATRGQGDAQSAKTFAGSFGKDPSFAAFYRSMQAYDGAISDTDTTMVLSPSSDFFKYFQKGPNAR